MSKTYLVWTGLSPVPQGKILGTIRPNDNIDSHWSAILDGYQLIVLSDESPELKITSVVPFSQGARKIADVQIVEPLSSVERKHSP